MNFTNKLKIKIIALLSSILLWIYVTSVVDPLESKTFKDVPIIINNSHLIKEKGLTVYPEKIMTGTINVKTNISKLRKINKDTLIINGTIDNPLPGKNIITLSSNLSDNIRHDIEPTVTTINLESIITMEKDITVIVNKKYNTDDYNIEIEKNKIEISGTSTLINKVDKVIGTMKSEDKDESISEKVELIPLDIDGKKVENIKLSSKYIDVKIEKIILEDANTNEPIETNTEEPTEKKDNTSNK